MKKLTCEHCGKEFTRTSNDLASARNKNTKHSFCCYKCSCLYKQERQKLTCSTCNKEFERTSSQLKRSKTGRFFCSSSCAATYNNTHKIKGIRVSKLELWLQQKLPKLYPDLEFHFNRKDAINSELDIYIPSLQLAFELNGIYHYEPIHGEEKLNQIQNNDNRKFAACIENNISLCIIDASIMKNFKEHKANDFLNIIKNVINQKYLARGR